MNYESMLAWVHGLPRLANKAGLVRMKKLMTALGNPQRRPSFVHIVGTNGKGSTTVMLASVLHSAGYKTGANISPYVLNFRERFQINGKMITEPELAKVMCEVRKASETLSEMPLEFEVVTATALLWFAQNGCDIACIEAGIGGGRDMTNVIENTLAVCVAKISFDHTELLGDTIEQIANEKSAVFKNECTVISYPWQNKKAAQVIAQNAKEKNCPLVVPLAEDIYIKKAKAFENHVTYKKYKLDIPFAGVHQAGNAAVVVEAALTLKNKGWKIESAHIVEGIAKARIPARIEILQKDPYFILDGAHNEDSALALAKTLEDANVKNLLAVVGILKDKQGASILKCIAPFVKTLYAVTPNSPRALPAEELAKLAKPFFNEIEICEGDLEIVINKLSLKKNGVLVCGSLYLAAQVRDYFVK